MPAEFLVQHNTIRLAGDHTNDVQIDMQELTRKQVSLRDRMIWPIEARQFDANLDRRDRRRPGEERSDGT